MEMKQEALIRRFNALVARQGDALGRLLAAAQRVVVEETLAGLRAGAHDITPAQLQIIQQICLSGGRVSVLVSRLQMTKQAVGQLLDGLERAGWVRREQDPADGRVRLVFYTAEGCQLVSDILDLTQRVERRLTERIGSRRMKALKATLSALSAN